MSDPTTDQLHNFGIIKSIIVSDTTTHSRINLKVLSHGQHSNHTQEINSQDMILSFQLGLSTNTLRAHLSSTSLNIVTKAKTSKYQNINTHTN